MRVREGAALVKWQVTMCPYHCQVSNARPVDNGYRSHNLLIDINLHEISFISQYTFCYNHALYDVGPILNLCLKF